MRLVLYETKIRNVISIIIWIIFILSCDVTADGSGNYPVPEKGDWEVNDFTKVWNESIVLNGNLSVKPDFQRKLR